jgi:hypothetical protein
MQLIVRSGVNGLLVPLEDDEAYPEHFRAVLLGKAFGLEPCYDGCAGA